MFRSTNPKIRAEASRFLDSLRDPFLKSHDDENNNYDDIKELKTTLSKNKTISFSTSNARKMSSAPRERFGGGTTILAPDDSTLVDFERGTSTMIL